MALRNRKSPAELLPGDAAAVLRAEAAVVEELEGLSARQREVMELVAACLEEAEIADSAPNRSRHRGASAQVISAEAWRAHARRSGD